MLPRSCHSIVFYINKYSQKNFKKSNFPVTVSVSTKEISNLKKKRLKMVLDLIAIPLYIIVKNVFFK